MQKIIKIPAEIYSRVVGYFRPVNQWNKGKREEFGERHEHNPGSIIKSTIQDGARERRPEGKK